MTSTIGANKKVKTPPDLSAFKKVETSVFKRQEPTEVSKLVNGKVVEKTFANEPGRTYPTTN